MTQMDQMTTQIKQIGEHWAKVTNIHNGSFVIHVQPKTRFFQQEESLFYIHKTEKEFFVREIAQDRKKGYYEFMCDGEVVFMKRTAYGGQVNEPKQSGNFAISVQSLENYLTSPSCYANTKYKCFEMAEKLAVLIEDVIQLKKRVRLG